MIPIHEFTESCVLRCWLFVVVMAKYPYHASRLVSVEDFLR